MTSYLFSLTLEVEGDDRKAAAQAAHHAFRPVAEKMLAIDAENWCQESDGLQGSIEGATLRFSDKNEAMKKSLGVIGKADEVLQKRCDELTNKNDSACREIESLQCQVADKGSEIAKLKEQLATAIAAKAEEIELEKTTELLKNTFPTLKTVEAAKAAEIVEPVKTPRPSISEFVKAASK
jgi:predicted phage tail protein